MTRTDENQITAHSNIPEPSMFGTWPVSAKWRREPADIDADIEGLPRDAELEKLMAQMDLCVFRSAWNFMIFRCIVER